MEKGFEVLESSYRDDPRFVIGMLVNLSGRYMNLGDTNGEYAALVKAERLARQLGDPERSGPKASLPEAIDAATKMARLLEARNEMDDLGYGTLATMLQVMLGAEGRRREARISGPHGGPRPQSPGNTCRSAVSMTRF